MIRKLASAYRFVASLDLFMLLGVLLIVGGTYSFVQLLDEVKEGSTQQFDNWAVETVGGWEAPRWLEEVVRDLTALGGIAVLTIVTVVVSGFLCLTKKYYTLLLVVIATVGALVISLGLKHAIDRPRPAIVEHRSHVVTKSFPSGHAMLSAAVYLTLGTLLARLTRQWRLKVFYVGVAMLLTAMVGTSRVFLGVHWPTDVLAGWSAGLAWAILCWLVARFLQHRGQVEAPE